MKGRTRSLPGGKVEPHLRRHQILCHAGAGHQHDAKIKLRPCIALLRRLEITTKTTNGALLNSVLLWLIDVKTKTTQDYNHNADEEPITIFGG